PEPEKLTSERPIVADELPDTLSKSPFRMLKVLLFARLTRLPATLRTLPPATLTRCPLATASVLDVRVIIDTASFGIETLALPTRLTAWSPVVSALPPLRLSSGAVASSNAVSTRYALPVTTMTALASASNTGAWLPG